MTAVNTVRHLETVHQDGQAETEIVMTATIGMIGLDATTIMQEVASCMGKMGWTNYILENNR